MYSAGLRQNNFQSCLFFQVAECSTPSIRGLLSSLPAMFMAFGISITYLLGAFLPWHILSYTCAIIPAVGLFTIYFIPESPVWLKSKGRSKEALASAVWLKNESAVDGVLSSNDA